MLPFIHHGTMRKLTQITLLVLMLWPAPVPVGHSHAGYAAQVSSQQMALHLQSCHGGFECSDSCPTDWHWHWMFPVHGYIDLGSEGVLAQSESMIAGEHAAVIEPMCLSYLATRTLKQSFLLPSPRTNCAHSFQNVGLLNSRQSLPELLGVIRC